MESCFSCFRSTKKKRWLAFGDSLTKGYYNRGRSFHPYTAHVEALCKQEKIEIEIVNAGISGDTTERMRSRLEEILRNQEEPFNYISILAGTNDLANEEDNPNSIFHRLEGLFKFALDSHPETVLVVITIPQSSFDNVYPEYISAKTSINQKIFQFYQHHKESEKVLYLDLYSNIPYPVSKVEAHSNKNSYYDDGIHLSPEGYELFGELIYKLLHPYF